MNILNKALKLMAFKKFDIIEREHAPWYVEFDNKKIVGLLEVLRNRKNRIQNHKNLPKETKETLAEITDDIILVGTLLSDSHVLKLKNVEIMSKNQVNEINNEKKDIEEFSE